MNPVVVLVAVTLFLSGLVGVTPAQAADEPPAVTVTWPEVTRFNPDQVDYTFTVTDTDGSGHLFAWWGASPQSVDPAPYPIPVPADGVVDMDFWTSMHGQVVIVRCPTATYDYLACQGVEAESPELDVFSAIALDNVDVVDDYLNPGPATARVSYAPALPTLTTTWALVDDPANPTQPPIASGTLDLGDLVTDPETGITSFPFTIPAGLASGDYYLTVHMAGDDADLGHLEGEFPPGRPQLVRVDSVTPELRVAKVPTTLYPASDNYLDSLEVRATASELTSGTLDVTDAAGIRVFRSAQHSVSPDGTIPSISWSGRSMSNRVVPAGRYTLKLTVVDAAGNQATWTSRVSVSHKKLQWVTYKRTLSASASRTGKPVIGRCSSLVKRPHGGLGYYSQTKCKGSNSESVVATDHGMYIPKAHQARYQWVQVTLNGSPATRSRNNYFVMGYVNPSNYKLVNERVFRTGNKHPGQRVTSRLIFDRKSDHPYVIWFNGLTAGSRYDVRSYTVQVRYQALR